MPAHVDARYNKSYTITYYELNTLSQRAQELKAISDRVCRERIEELRKKRLKHMPPFGDEWSTDDSD